MRTARPNLALVGFMATGKSTVGHRLAKRLTLRFLDLDARIERRAGKPIARIFAEDGEPAFRALERAAAAELRRPAGLVIATGGGIVLNPDNLRHLAQGGLVVCLTARATTVLRRTAGDTTRPLLQHANPLARIRALLRQRRPLYAAIPHRVATDALTPAAVCERIAKLYERHGQSNLSPRRTRSSRRTER